MRSMEAQEAFHLKNHPFGFPRRWCFSTLRPGGKPVSWPARPQPGEAVAITDRWNIVIDGIVIRYSSPSTWDNYYNYRNHYNKRYCRSKQPSRKRSLGPGIVLDVGRRLTSCSLPKNWAALASVHPPCERGGRPGRLPGSFRVPEPRSWETVRAARPPLCPTEGPS